MDPDEVKREEQRLRQMEQILAQLQNIRSEFFKQIPLFGAKIFCLLGDIAILFEESANTRKVVAKANKAL